MNKILITGGAGYVGSRVTAYMLNAGLEVTVLDKLVYGGESLISFFDHPGFRLIKGDVRDYATVAEAVKGAEAVLHLAAVVGEAACALDEEMAQQINCDGTKTALSAASEGGVGLFIFPSTCSNYGVSDPHVLADEDSPLKPLTKYAESKVETEELVLGGDWEMDSVVLRFATICGLSARMRFDLLVSDMARAAVRGDAIDIYGPKAWRPFLHILDAARVVEHCLGADRARLNGKVFNVVGENYKKSDLAELTRKHYPKATIEVTDKKPDLRDYRVSGERIKEELGFETKYSVENAFMETAAAIERGVFRDPFWKGHSAVPEDAGQLKR